MKTAEDFLSKFREDDYITGMIKSDSATSTTFNPYFRGHRVNQEGTAFRNFWSDTNASLLRYHFERFYDVNTGNTRQMSRVLIALKILFFELRRELIDREREPD